MPLDHVRGLEVGKINHIKYDEMYRNQYQSEYKDDLATLI